MNSGKNRNGGGWAELLGAALDRRPAGGEELLLFHEDRLDAVAVLDDLGGAPRIDWSRTHGLSAWGARGRRFSLADPSPEDALGLVRRLDDARTEGPPSATVTRPDEGRIPMKRALTLLTELVSTTKKLQSRARVTARWIGFDQRVGIARSSDPAAALADRRTGFRVRLEAVREDRGQRSIAVGEAVLTGEEFDPRELTGRVAERCEALLDARSCPNGPRRVVFAPGVGGVLIHELVGHALEADTVINGASWLVRGSSARPVGSLQLRVLDDPRRCRAAWRYDDEGEPARPTPLLREGRVSGWLHDRRSARHAGRPTTGHGRRSSFREPVRPRMGCTFVAAGNAHPGEALEDLDDGILVRRMEAASTETATGRAVFRVTDSDRIRHGKIDQPLKPHLMVVDGAEALASVERVADDLAFDTCIGSCLHHGQPLPISVGAPTFRIGVTTVVF